MKTSHYILFAIVLLYIHTAYAQVTEPASKEELEELKGIVDGINESATEYRTYVDVLRKIKISGYIQSQFRLTDRNGTAAQYSGGNFPANVNKQFQVRRGRIKVNYDNVLTQFVVELDATQNGVAMRDAYISITEPWLQSFGIQTGVFYRPFGYETSYSSGNRESPEQSRLFQTVLPGERGLGASFFFAPQIGAMSFMRAEVGVFNGSGPAANEFDNFKDLIGRVGVQLPFDDVGAALDLGVSGYLGNVRNATRYVWSQGEPVPGVKGMVVDSLLSNRGAGVGRNYLGVDFQFYYDLPALGGLVLRGEIIGGQQPGGSDSTNPAGISGRNLSTVSPSTQPSGPIYKRKFLGWYLNLVQNIGDFEQIVLKYDVYDPNTGVSGSDFVPQSNLGTADLKFSTLGMGLIHHWDANVKILLYYEMVRNEKVTPLAGGSLAAFAEDVKDNVLTFRIQYKF